jgi:hypothetical protein
VHDSDDGNAGGPGGQRLRAMFIESPKGLSVFRHFYDTELGSNCHFAPAEPGVWRCLPAADETARASEILFADPDCTTPHVALYGNAARSNTCTPVRHVTVGGQCGSLPSVFELGSPSSAATRYHVVDGVCTVTTDGTEGFTDLYTVTPIPLEEFQSGRLREGDETGGVVPLDVVSDDGARFRMGFRDAEEGFDCRLGGADDDARCYPSGAGIVRNFFADSGCTVPAANSSGCEQGEMAFAWDYDERVYYRGGARLPARYMGTPDSCEPSPEGDAFEVGAEVPFTRFAAGTRTTVVAGALETQYENVGTASLSLILVRSTAHGGFDCHFAQGSDGELRCLPSPNASSEVLFADAACTERVDSPSKQFLAIGVPGVCPERIRVYAQGARHAGAVYAITAEGCTFAYDRPPNDSERWPHFVYPTEIPPNEFEMVMEVARRPPATP